MKGTPAEPQCGFSRAVVQILDLHGVPPEKMKTYNVLADPELRSGIKEFSCVYTFFLYLVNKLSHGIYFDIVNGRLFPKCTLMESLWADVIFSLAVCIPFFRFFAIILTKHLKHSAPVRGTRNTVRKQRCYSQSRRRTFNSDRREGFVVNSCILYHILIDIYILITHLLHSVGFYREASPSLASLLKSLFF